MRLYLVFLLVESRETSCILMRRMSWNEILDHLSAGDPPIELVVFDLSTTNHVDLAGARMVRRLHQELSSQKIKLKLVGARGNVRDLLRLDGLEELVGRNYRHLSLDTIVNQEKDEREEPQVFGH